MRALAVAFIAAAIVVACASGGSVQTRDWTSYSGGDTMSNDAASTTITPKTAPKLAAGWSRELDGAIYASPLYVKTGVAKPLVLVATMGDSLYALSAANGAVVWKRSLGPTTPTVCHSNYGIASTPYIDTSAKRVYVIGAGGSVYALDLATGKPLAGWPVRIVKRTNVEFAWSGLRVHNGLLYVNVASYCDVPDANGLPADGYTVAVDVRTHKIAARLDIVPGPHNMGGAWGWGGVSIAADGTLYLATGNSVVYVNGNLDEDAPYAEAVLHLTPRLKVLAWGEAPDKAAENRGDEDFGSTPLLFQPSGCPPLLAANSKNGYTYVWRRSNLKTPVWKALMGPTAPDEPFLAEPSYDAATRMLVISKSVFGTGANQHRGVTALRANANCTSFSTVWNSNVGPGAQPPPLIVGGVVVSAVASQQMLYAFDVRNGTILWEKKIAPSQAPIATSGAAIYVGDSNGTITSYAPK